MHRFPSSSSRRGLWFAVVAVGATAGLLVGSTSVPGAAAAVARNVEPGAVTKVRAAEASVVRGGPALPAPTRVDPPFSARDAAAATATMIVNFDSGFNSNLAAKAAFQAAVDIWATQVQSRVPIVIDASFTAQDPGVLGSAFAHHDRRDFPGAPLSHRWYPAALANALAGKDLDPADPDIEAAFDNTTNWYFGTDGNPGAAQYDFETVVLHELGHGLGFSGFMRVSFFGSGRWGDDQFCFSFPSPPLPRAYDEFTTSNGTPLLSFPNCSTALGTALTTTAIRFAGANATAANGGTPPLLYAPNPWDQGSSYSHLDEATFPAGTPNSLMTPVINQGESDHDPGPITLGIFKDLGWGRTPIGPPAAWKVASAANPAGSTGAGLSGVACPTTASCFVVGSHATAGATKSLVEHWNGHGWAIQASANPGGASVSRLSAVACPTARSCFAVGSFTTPSATKSLVEHWNGSTWGAMGTPNPSGSTAARLTGVSCPSAKSCFAVGSFTTASATKNLVEHWNGRNWGVLGSINLSSSTLLSGVSCPSAKSCFAVGSYTRGSVPKALVEHWNGANWGVMTSPNPAGSTSAGLNGVTCPITKSCFAVGNATTGSVPRAIVEHWNGHDWGILASPKPGGWTTGGLSGVSCPNPKSCFAVGSYTTSSVPSALVEHWNGAAWAIMTATNPGSVDNHLLGVACTSSKTCFAVGDFTSGIAGSVLVERYG